MKKRLVAAVLISLIATLGIVNITSSSSATTTTYRKTLGVVLEPDPYKGLPALEKLTGHKFKRFLWYQSIIEDFNRNLADWLYARGTLLQLSWEPRDPSKDSVKQPAYSLKSIYSGSHDAAIKKWARQLKSFGKIIFFRPMCEMNGNWTSWSGTVNGNQPWQYKYAWRRIYNIFQKEGATNVKFVWSPNRDGSNASAKKTFDTYFPGASYVHYLGINGYNWGTMYKTSTWTSSWQNFDAIFGYSYNTFAALSSKPFIIAEMGSTELGGDKASWMVNYLCRLRYGYPRIKEAYYFNLNKETDWRIQSSTKSLNAFKYYSTYHY